MLIHVVLWHGSLIGLYTCATDAAVASKALHHSTVVTCHLNAETANGTVPLAKATPTLVRSPSPEKNHFFDAKPAALPAKPARPA